MEDKHDLLFLFERPAEPLDFVKGDGKVKFFVVSNGIATVFYFALHVVHFISDFEPGEERRDDFLKIFFCITFMFSDEIKLLQFYF